MVKAALKRPITVVVLFIGLLLFSVISLRSVPIDIFPSLNSPTVYVIQQYGGMSARQMEAFLSSRCTPATKLLSIFRWSSGRSRR